METKKVFLPEASIPRSWYNILADLPIKPPPVLHPGTHEPITPNDLAPLFPEALIAQEVSEDRYIEIPEPILDIYKLWRPTPLVRATNFEKALGTKSRIYFKNESVSPPGSHKPNTAVAQAYYNFKEGVKVLTTETGAGQWGSALSFACNFFGLECRVFMVRISYDQKPFRKSLIESWGASIYPSPSEITELGKQLLSEDPNHPGSLGIAITEAVESAVRNQHTKYALGSVLNHVLLHQTIIGEEAKRQFELIGDYPDVIVGCVGGGSNFSGIAFPFITPWKSENPMRAVAVEPSACPTLTRGKYAYDFGDTGELTPLVAMYTLGHKFVPPKIHAGGLRYHGAAPLLSHLLKNRWIEARNYQQLDVFKAGILFAKTEGIIPAPESNHAIKGAADEALRADSKGTPKTILFNLSGHGHFDMSSYDAYFSNQLQDYQLDESAMNRNLQSISGFPPVESS